MLAYRYKDDGIYEGESTCQKDPLESKLKGELQATDYKCLKFVDGALTEEEYAEVRIARQALRDQINDVQAEIDALEEKSE